MAGRLLVLIAMAAIGLTSAGNAGERRWALENTGGDLEAVRADGRRSAFSARTFVQSLVPPEYVISERPADQGCAIETTIKPLSLFNDILSFAITYRRLPGDCTPPLRDGGYHAVRAVHLETGQEARLNELPAAPALLTALRQSSEIIALLGDRAHSSPSLVALFTELDKATAKRCDRRLAQDALSAFYLDRAAQQAALRFHIAFANACGQLGDEPASESIDVPLPDRMAENNNDARVLDAPTLQFRFAPAHQ